LLALTRVVSERTPRTFFAPLSRGPRPEARPTAPQRPAPPADLGSLQEILDDTLRDAERPEQERLARRLRSYEIAAREELEPAHVQDQVLGFSDVLVYRPAHVLLVVARGASELDVLSALLAARLAGARVELCVERRSESTRFERLVPEDAERFETPAELRALTEGRSFDRVRLLGPLAGRVSEALAGLLELCPSLEAEPVHDAGYVELRRYVLEQSQSVARHRHGNLSLSAAVERRKAGRKP
jgi:hypothetical protein